MYEYKVLKAVYLCLCCPDNLLEEHVYNQYFCSYLSHPNSVSELEIGFYCGVLSRREKNMRKYLDVDQTGAIN